MDITYDGHTETPRKKPSTKKTPKKGTGKGVCQVTKKKHKFTGIAVSHMYHNSQSGMAGLQVHQVCEDCQGVRHHEFLRSEDLKTLYATFLGTYGIRIQDAQRVREDTLRVK